MMKRFFTLCLILILCGCSSAEFDAACRVTVTAETAALPAEYREILPEDGVIYSSDVEFERGETLLAVMRRAMREERIPLVSENGYISAIGGIATGGAGPMSGWMFTINGETPMEGCDTILLNEGDAVAWTYVTEWVD